MWLRGLNAGLRTESRWFDSQSGHMPGLQARSPLGGVRKATDQCISHTLMFLFLYPSLPLSLKINKVFKNITTLLDFNE